MPHVVFWRMTADRGWIAAGSPPLIPGKSRVRKRARTDLCGGRSAMVVPTATATFSKN